MLIHRWRCDVDKYQAMFGITEKAGSLMNKCVTHFLYCRPMQSQPVLTLGLNTFIRERRRGVDDRGNKRQGRILGLDDRFVY